MVWYQNHVANSPINEYASGRGTSLSLVLQRGESTSKSPMQPLCVTFLKNQTVTDGFASM